MKIFSVILFLLSFSVSFSQKVDWSKTKSWKIYAVNSSSAFHHPMDSFQNKRSADMNDSTIVALLNKSHIWPQSQYAHWMGMYYGSYELETGQLNKIVFSAYGGFLFDYNTKRYYEIPESLRKKWSEYLYSNLERVFE